MRVFNENKDTELNFENINLDLGYLKEDYLISIIPGHPGKEEQGHYEIIKEYPETGGKDLQWVIDQPKIEEKKEIKEEEPILVFIPYSDEELLIKQKVKQEEEKSEKLAIQIKDKKEILNKISEDIIQFLLGEKIQDITSRCDDFLQRHNELRILENKEPRTIGLSFFQQLEKNIRLNEEIISNENAIQELLKNIAEQQNIIYENYEGLFSRIQVLENNLKAIQNKQ